MAGGSQVLGRVADGIHAYLLHDNVQLGASDPASFDVIRFFVRSRHRWDDVPPYDAEKRQDSLTSFGGAYSLLHAFRLVSHELHTPMSLLLADRDYVDSFEMQVTFRIYDLVKNENSHAGWPALRFQLRMRIAQR